MWLKAGLILGVTFASSGCYLRPQKVSSPQESAQHVRVSVVGEDCESDQDNGDVEIEPSMTLKLKVENPTDHALELTPSRLQLTSGEQTSTGEGNTPYSVGPGQSHVFAVHFDQIDGCNKPFELAFADSVQLGTEPIQLASVRFRD
jgi:hypothetical protein